MNQETYNSEMAYSHAGNESVSWGGAMGPLGPLAMFRQGLSDTQPTSTPTQRFDAPHQEASTDHPDRQPLRTRSTMGQPRADTRQDTELTTQEDPVVELLRVSNVDETRIGWLLEEGFTTRRTLALLTPSAVDTLVASHASGGNPPGTGSCPQARRLRGP